MNDTERLDIYIAVDQSIGLLSSLPYSSNDSVGEWKIDLTKIKRAITTDRGQDEPDTSLKSSLLEHIGTLSEKMSADFRERYPERGLPEIPGGELVTVGQVTRDWQSWTPDQGNHALALVNLLALPLGFEQRSRAEAKTSTESAVDSCDNRNDV